MRRTLLVLLAAAAVHAQDAGPKEAWLALYDKPDAERRAGARRFLAEWTAPPRGDDHHFLGFLLSAAGREDDAQRARQACARDTRATADFRAASTAEFTRVVLRRLWDRVLNEKQLATAVRDLEELLALLPKSEVDYRTMLVQALAQVHDVQGDEARMLARWKEAVALSPDHSVRDAASAIAHVFMKRSLDGGNYDELRRALDVELDALRKHSKHPSIAATAERFALLGRPVAALEVEHAFGTGRRLKDYRGKVVLVDCWATWCVWCIRGFPAVRRLRREFKDLAIVGVTTRASRVWPARYDLDADMAHKGGAAKPIVRPDPALEVKTIGAFVKNHELPWDTLLVKTGDPERKLGLRGWPHAVVIDRQGRIRALHSGALGFDKQADAKLRALIKRLLAEDYSSSSSRK